MSTETIEQLREIKQELLEELLRVKRECERQKEQIEGLISQKLEIVEELQEVKDWWIEAANGRDQLKRDLSAAPVRFTEKTRKRNETRRPTKWIGIRGSSLKLGGRSVGVTDESTVENQSTGAFLEVILELSDQRIRLKREGVAELRNELQRILDFNPTAR